VSLTHRGCYAVRAIGQAHAEVYQPLPNHGARGGSSISATLLDKLFEVHNMFHVSQLRKYIPDPTHVIEPEPLWLREDLTYKEQLIEFLEHREKRSTIK